MPEISFTTALISGGIAGTSVDVALFPIDAIKTRLQSPQGFHAAGGFRGIYRGLGAAAAGSAPGAALFFSTYERLKPVLVDLQSRAGFGSSTSFSHMIAAAIGEMVACLVRVPTEVVKSKMQTCSEGGKQTVRSTLISVLQEKEANAFLSNVTGGLYRGYGITIMREVPFAFIQFPIYEQAKISWGEFQGREVTPVQAAVCGSFGGAIASAVTTPLDVLKTRMMLGKDSKGVPYRNAMDVFQKIMADEGASTLLSGIRPRVLWISIGGFIFFGAYEFASSVVSPLVDDRRALDP